MFNSEKVNHPDFWQPAVACRHSAVANGMRARPHPLPARILLSISASSSSSPNYCNRYTAGTTAATARDFYGQILFFPPILYPSRAATATVSKLRRTPSPHVFHVTNLRSCLGHFYRKNFSVIFFSRSTIAPTSWWRGNNGPRSHVSSRNLAQLVMCCRVVADEGQIMEL